MREITLRHIHPGDHDTDILQPLFDCMRHAGVTIANVYTVPEIDIYAEGVLPPVVTLFCDKELLSDGPPLVDSLAVALEGVIERYKSIGRNGHTTAAGEFREASDLGVFVMTGGALAKYYFKPNDFSAEGLRDIRRTFDSAALTERLASSESLLGTIVLWNRGHWQLFVSGPAKKAGTE